MDPILHLSERQKRKNPLKQRVMFSLLVSLLDGAQEMTRF